MRNKFDDERNPSIDGYFGRRETDNQDHSADQDTIEDCFDGMMSKGSRNIDFRVGMVDSMKAPQDIDPVQKPVLSIGQSIQAHNRNNDSNSARQFEQIEKTRLFEFREEGGREHRDGRQYDKPVGDDAQRQIADPTSRSLARSRPPR